MSHAHPDRSQRPDDDREIAEVACPPTQPVDTTGTEPAVDTLRLPVASQEWLGASLAASCYAKGEKLTCWGSNAEVATAPTEVSLRTVVGTSLEVAQFALGVKAFCVLATDGRVWCSSSPFAPVALVATAYRFSQVEVSYYTVCGIRPSGKGACWGDGSFGALGDGTRGEARSLVLAPTQIAGPRRFALLRSHESGWCGVEVGTRQTYCWGESEGSVIAVPSFAGSCGASYWFRWVGLGCIVPTAIDSLPPTGTSAGTGIAGCFADTFGTVRCFGVGAYGELANGRTGEANVLVHPAAILSGERFVALTAGNAFFCGISDRGVSWCWGNNFRGYLGIGLPNCGSASCPPLASALPVALGLSRTTLLASSGRHVCARADGGVWCWGVGLLGQVGFPTGDVGTPRLVLPLASQSSR